RDFHVTGVQTCALPILNNNWSEAMKIGLPKEIKDNEYRVGLTPAGVNALVLAGHDVFVQRSAGEGSGIPDDQYVDAGGKILETRSEERRVGEECRGGT